MTKRKAPSGEDVLELARLMERLRSIDLDQVKQEEVERLPEMEQLIHAIENDKKVVRHLKDNTGVGRKRKKPKEHWHTKQARMRKKRKEYYHAVRKPKKREAKAELLKTPEGWWKHISRGWQMHKEEVEITEQEWLEIVWPALGGAVPVIRRYNPGLPFSLDNIIVYRNRTNEVLFDGKEYLLRKEGYIL